MRDLDPLRDRLASLERGLIRLAPDLALLLVADSPGRVEERPALARLNYAERTASFRTRAALVDTFRTLDAYVQLFEGEKRFIEALADNKIHRLGRRVYLVRNEFGWGITPGGFRPGMRSLVPALADSYGLVCIGSSAYTSSLAQHKYHSFLILKSLGLPVPKTWHYRQDRAWMGNQPPIGTKVITKSTYEAWAVGVTPDSVFVVDGTVEERLTDIATAIGQPVTVQEFVSGKEVCVSAIACPDWHVLPPVEQILLNDRDNADAVLTLADNLNDALEYTSFRAPDALVSRLRSLTLEVIDILQIENMARIDFRISSDGHPWITDVATSPSWSDDGSFYTAIAQLGFNYRAFLRLVPALSLASQHMITF